MDPNNQNNPPEYTPEVETWMVSDHQTVNFNGTITQAGSALALGGTFSEQDQGQWIYADDHLLPSDPNHHESRMTDAMGDTLDFSVTKMVPATSF